MGSSPTFHPGAFSRRNGRKSLTAPPKRAMRQKIREFKNSLVFVTEVLLFRCTPLFTGYTSFVRKKCHFIAYFGEFPQIYATKSFWTINFHPLIPSSLHPFILSSLHPLILSPSLSCVRHLRCRKVSSIAPAYYAGYPLLRPLRPNWIWTLNSIDRR